MISRGVLLLLFWLAVVGIHAQINSLPARRITLGRIRPPVRSRPPYSCPRSYCTSDNPRCSMRPGSFMPCVTYRLPVSVASCDCRLWLARGRK